jgi:predicted DNA-binding protein with PD1-like motif
MRVHERKIGRIFQLSFGEDDDFLGELNRFVKEKNIRAGSVFIFGAMSTTDMVAGWRSTDRSDSDRRHFDDRREFLGVGDITFLEKPPPALGDVTWSEPQPYIHIHIALSGGVGKTEEVLVGHLSGGGLAGAFAEIYEFV